MCKEKIIDNRTRQRERIPLPNYPEREWCDFRRDYESGMTYKKIVEKYCCDPRTVKRCIWYNKSSIELGSQTKPTKIAAFVDLIDAEYCEIVFGQSDHTETPGICDISDRITEVLKQNGYTGGERTVRNYLRVTYQFAKDPDEPGKEQGND